MEDLVIIVTHCVRILRPPGGGSSDNCYTLCWSTEASLVEDLVIIVIHCVTE